MSAIHTHASKRISRSYRQPGEWRWERCFCNEHVCGLYRHEKFREKPLVKSNRSKRVRKIKSKWTRKKIKRSEQKSQKKQKSPTKTFPNEIVKHIRTFVLLLLLIIMWMYAINVNCIVLQTCVFYRMQSRSQHQQPSRNMWKNSTCEL